MIEGMTFLYPELIHLVWAVVALVALLAWLELRGQSALARFLSPVMLIRLSDRPSLSRRIVKLVLLLATLVLGVVALMRPQSHGAEMVSSRRVSSDIMVVLDVSKSMLAEDAAPNRLARARAEIIELVDQLQGHRVGLVAFAGRASVLCPLTPDYGFFRMILRAVDTTSVGRGGTRIGEAVRKGVAAFGPGSGARLILLITDGEDHDSYPREAAGKAAEAGIRIVAIGFGSEDGSEITLTDPETGARRVLVDGNGLVVRSRLDGELLREIALETDGVYVPAGTAALDLESIVDAHVKPIMRQTETVERAVAVERYHWFIAASLVALCGAIRVGSRTGRRTLA